LKCDSEVPVVRLTAASLVQCSSSHHRASLFTELLIKPHKMNTMAYNRSWRVFAYIIIAIFAVLVFLAKSYNKQLQKELLSCDEECDRFGRLLDTWPVDKPKAAIIMLLQPSSVDKFARSAHLFTNHFNDAYDYPMIVFHEENLNTEGDRQRLRSLTNSSLYFQVLCTQAT